MTYTYDIAKRFNGKKPYNYWLEDSYYKSDSLMKEGGRKFKRFYDELAQHIFDINLEIVEQIGDFPIVYNERSNSAAIAMALSRITPYVISELSVDCKGVELHGELQNESESKEQQRRAIDFWCATHADLNKGLDVWVESKHIWLNVGKRAKWEFVKGTSKHIQKAFKQISQIKHLARQDRIGDGVKVALFSVGVYCSREQCVRDLSELDSIPIDVAAMLESQAREYFTQANFGVLVGVLDLRSSINLNAKEHSEEMAKQNTYHIYGGGYLPFILLGAVVLP